MNELWGQKFNAVLEDDRKMFFNVICIETEYYTESVWEGLRGDSICS